MIIGGNHDSVRSTMLTRGIFFLPPRLADLPSTALLTVSNSLESSSRSGSGTLSVVQYPSFTTTVLICEEVSWLLVLRLPGFLTGVFGASLMSSLIGAFSSQRSMVGGGVFLLRRLCSERISRAAASRRSWIRGGLVSPDSSIVLGSACALRASRCDFRFVVGATGEGEGSLSN